MLKIIRRSSASTEVPPKLAVSVSLANSSDLRVVLSVLYTIIETIRIPSEDEREEQKMLRESFQEELAMVGFKLKDVFDKKIKITTC